MASETKTEALTGFVLQDSLRIRRQYQDWILTAGCAVAASITCLPCLLRGSRSRFANAFLKWVEPRRHAYFCCSGVLNVGGLGLLIYACPNWTVDQFIVQVGLFFLWILRHAEKFCVSALIIFVFYILFRQRQKIYSAMGVENSHFLRMDIKDVVMCARPRTLELFVWKAEELPGADLLKPNDVFLQVHFSYNGGPKTRVHNNVGSQCVFRESIQLNFDDNDEDSKMTVWVCNQDSLASSTIGMKVFSNDEVRQLLSASASSSGGFTEWHDAYFEEIKLNPSGKVWLRLADVEIPDDEMQLIC